LKRPRSYSPDPCRHGQVQLLAATIVPITAHFPGIVAQTPQARRLAAAGTTPYERGGIGASALRALAAVAALGCLVVGTGHHTDDLRPNPHPCVSFAQNFAVDCRTELCEPPSPERVPVFHFANQIQLVGTLAVRYTATISTGKGDFGLPKGADPVFESGVNNRNILSAEGEFCR